MKKTTWDDHAMVLELLLTLKRADWQVELPPFDSLPCKQLEQEVDAWCERLTKDLEGEMCPPPDVAPWILARIFSMLATARILAGNGDTDAPELTPNTMIQFLLGEWHGAFLKRLEELLGGEDVP